MDEAGSSDKGATLGDLVLSATQALDVVAQVADYAIFAMDPQGTIESWNLGAERAKGYTADEVVGQNFSIFYTEEARADGLPLRLLARAAQRGRVEDAGWRLRKDGTRFWAEVVITAVHNRAGRLVGFTKVVRDRSEVKDLEDAQDAFYASFTHDFRTPVASLLSKLEALRDADTDGRQDLIDHAEESAERLMSMVEDLVTFARQRKARGTMLTGEIDVAAVARQVAQDLAPRYAAGRVRVGPDEIALARANGTALHRVLTNLVVNALAYSGDDTVVDVVFHDMGEDGVEISVVDGGRGIDEDDLDSVFDGFQRGRLAEDDGGTGLGLTSARDLVHQMGGDIRIESEVEVGTMVTIHLEAVPSHLDGLPGDGTS